MSLTQWSAVVLQLNGRSIFRMTGLKLNPQIRLRLERKNAMQPLKTIATLASFLSEGVKVAPPPGEAVCVAQDVVLRHQRATAHVAAILLEAGHPWPHAGTAHRVSACQPRVQRCAATDHSWGAAGQSQQIQAVIYGSTLHSLDQKKMWASYLVLTRSQSHNYGKRSRHIEKRKCKDFPASQTEKETIAG